MFESIFTSNEFFQGGLALAAMGGVVAGLRYLPKVVIHYVQRFLTTTIYVRDGTLVEWLADWLGGTTNRTRWYAGKVQNDVNGKRIVTFPGEGLHVIRKFDRRFWLWSSLEDNGIAGKIQTFTIRCYGREKAPLERFLNSVKELAEERERGKNVTYINNVWGDWIRLRAGNPRNKNSVILASGQLEDILSDVENFIGARERYLEIGTPYRRGFMFQGAPGNGKSTMVQVLSTEFKLPIYALVLSDNEFTDSKLANAVGNIPEKAILLIEDLDRVDFKKTSITPSGFLNVIDGPMASEGRLFIVTANDPDKIDPAFKRGGRIDRIWDFNNPTKDQIERTIGIFKQSFDDRNAFIKTALEENMNHSTIRNILSNGAFHNGESKSRAISEQAIGKILRHGFDEVHPETRLGGRNV